MWVTTASSIVFLSTPSFHVHSQFLLSKLLCPPCGKSGALIGHHKPVFFFFLIPRKHTLVNNFCVLETSFISTCIIFQVCFQFLCTFFDIISLIAIYVANSESKYFILKCLKIRCCHHSYLIYSLLCLMYSCYTSCVPCSGLYQLLC